MPEIVLTYFEPFGNRSTNVSKEVALSFESQFELHKLKVSWNDIEEELDSLEEPNYLFMLGEAGKYSNITIELEAKNLANGVDNLNVSKNEEPILKDEPSSLLTNIDFSAYKGSASISHDAGKYLCNCSYYLALRKLKKAKVVFIHFPYIDENNNSLQNLCYKLREIVSYVISRDLETNYYDFCPLEAKAIRNDIFIKEQGFAKEFDEIDAISTHFLLKASKTPIATCRLFFDASLNAYHLGRIAVKKEYRNLGIGTRLIEEVIHFLKTKGVHEIILGAQVKAKDFYTKNGFESFGDIHLDESVPHVMMKKSF